MPEGWEWTRLGYLAQYKKGPFGSSITKAMFIPEAPDAIKVYEQKMPLIKTHLLVIILFQLINMKHSKDLKYFQMTLLLVVPVLLVKRMFYPKKCEKESLIRH